MNSSRAGWLAVLLAALLAVGAALSAVPAPITIDDVSYAMMARDLAAGRGLTIWNGYEERPSPELQLIVPETASQIAAHQGRLVSQYPAGYALLAVGPFVALGQRGLFGLNALGGGIAVILTFALARRSGAGPWEALAGAATLAVATYLVDYMLGVPPHPVACALGLGAWLLLERSLAVSTFWGALGAGVLLGAALGVRLDALVMIGALGFVAVTDPRGRPRHLVALGLGLTPALALLSATNMLKFGVWSPFSYGNAVANTAGLGAYATAMAVALPFGLALVMAGRPTWSRHLPGPLRRPLVLPLLALGMVLIWPTTRAGLAALAEGSWALWGDLRDIPEVGVEISDALTPGRAMLHWGSIKKALVQSLPWLGLAPLWIIGALGSSAEAARWRALLLVPLGITALTGPRAYHGGGALSLRYFVPALPFLAALCACTLALLARDTPRARWPAAALLGLGGLVVPLVLAPDPDGAMAVSERFWLSLPLALAGCLALGSLGWGALRALERPRGGLAALTLGLALAGLGWAAGVTWSYDVPRRLAVREFYLTTGREVAAALPQGGIAFGALAEHIGGAVEHPQTRLALAPLDDGEDLGALCRIQLEAGRGCVGLFSQRAWRFLASTGRLTDFQTTLLWSGEPFELRRITPLSTSRSTPPPAPPSSGG